MVLVLHQSKDYIEIECSNCGHQWYEKLFKQIALSIHCPKCNTPLSNVTPDMLKEEK